MNVKIKFTEQSQHVAELKQEISRLETKVHPGCPFAMLFTNILQRFCAEFRNVGRG